MTPLKLAFRNLVKSPFVTVVAVLSLALGIGSTAAIYSLFDQMIVRALPVQAPERLVNLSSPGPKPGSQSSNQAGDGDHIFSYPMFRDLEEKATGLAGVAAHRGFGANLTYGEGTESGEGMLVSGSYFPLLGLEPELGRLLGPDDDRVIGQHRVAVLSHRFWRTRMGSDRGVVGERLVVNGETLTIVGVAPRGFDGTTLGSTPDVFVPLTLRAEVEPWFQAEDFDDRRVYWAYVFGRLAPGGTVEQARAELQGTYGTILAEVEAPLQEGLSPATMERFLAKEIGVEPGPQGQSSLQGDARRPLLLLFAITGVVLLIACANIANLLLARGAARGAEMAIRSSLGAGRGRLLVQLLAESALLALLGGLVGLAVAHGTLRLIGSLLPSLAGDSLELALSPQVVLFSGALVLATGLLFGLYPALHATRPDLVTALKSGAGRASGARSAARFRTVLATAQIALATALLVAAGLFVQSLANVSRVDLGLDGENLVTFSIAPVLNGYEPEASLALFERLEDELAAVPGVTDVTAALVPVLAGSSWGTDVNVEGFERGPDTDANARFNRVGPGYFATMGVPLVAGREFTPADRGGTTDVAIVNQTFARKFGLAEDGAVGKWMSEGGDELDMQIVGVVADAKYANVKDEVPPVFVRPYRQGLDLDFMNFYLRSEIDPEEIIAAVPGVVARLDPNLPVDELKTLDLQVRENVFLDRMITTLSAAFAVLATLLAAIGLYGVLAFTVAQRTRELGVRMALGAGRGRVRALVLGQMGKMLAVGGVLGLAGAVAAGRAAQSLLFGLEWHDPLVIASGVGILVVVALLAAYLPARKASLVDPVEALRSE